MARIIVSMAALKIARVPLVHHFSSHASATCWVRISPVKVAVTQPLDDGQRWLVRSMSREADSGEARRVPSRLAETKRILDALPAYPDDAHVPIPKISLEHVTVTFARSGGAGGQNVNKVNTKVDMRFNVMSANWLPERVRLKLLQMEKNRINGDGELVVSSTRTRTQKGNIDDALEKLKEMIDAAAYVPPPPTEETKKKIEKLARIENERRLQDKKRSSSKKADRRSKGSWD